MTRGLVDHPESADGEWLGLAQRVVGAWSRRTVGDGMGWLDAAMDERAHENLQSLQAAAEEATRRLHVMATTIVTTRGFDEMLRGELTDVANATWKGKACVVTNEFD